MKKEYILKIVYDPKTDEIEHLSEQHIENVNFVIEIDGVDIPITNEMGEYMMKHVDNKELGLS